MVYLYFSEYTERVERGAYWSKPFWWRGTAAPGRYGGKGMENEGGNMGILGGGSHGNQVSESVYLSALFTEDG